MDITPHFGISLTTLSLLPPVLVYWRTPPKGSYKINSDGCVKDGFASRWRIIRYSLDQSVSVFVSSSLHMVSALFWRPNSELFLTVSFLLRELFSQIYGLSPALLWSFTTSLEVEDLGLFRPLLATSDISLLSTLILFFIFITRTIRWLTYLLQRAEIVIIAISSTVSGLTATLS
ncbi:hypothetical protein Adt_21535 [Abeliophyllum distichum]|uniref:Uncharacterized protein n=1 Tax=Abeliophyllum distichum TaxID=126358 RepID=A0ABD1SZL5_9LAMI